MILYYNIKPNIEDFDNIVTKTINFYVIKYNELIRLKEVEIPIEDISLVVIQNFANKNNYCTIKEIY